MELLEALALCNCKAPLPSCCPTPPLLTKHDVYHCCATALLTQMPRRQSATWTAPRWVGARSRLPLLCLQARALRHARKPQPAALHGQHLHDQAVLQPPLVLGLAPVLVPVLVEGAKRCVLHGAHGQRGHAGLAVTTMACPKAQRATLSTALSCGACHLTLSRQHASRNGRRARACVCVCSITV